LYVQCLDRLQLSIVDVRGCDIFNDEEIEDGLKVLKRGKASGFDGLTKEHIHHAHIVISYLKVLFSMIYAHGFVPDDFVRGITIPVKKDSHGDLSGINNYRPITVSRVISKIFEYRIIHKFKDSFTQIVYSLVLSHTESHSS